MKLLRTIVALTVLAAWLPAASHCLLAGAHLLPGDCEQEHQHGDAPTHSHDDCGVCVLESGNFKLTDAGSFHFAFHATLTWDSQLPSSPEFVGNLGRLHSDRAPPDLTRWQFQTRAALPGRAPAIL